MKLPKLTRDQQLDLTNASTKILCIITVISFIYYIFSQIHWNNKVYQTVTLLDSEMQYELQVDWQEEMIANAPIGTNIDSLSRTNPYDTKKELFILKTEANKYSTSDIGTADEIRKLKCQRFAEYTAIIENDKRLDSISEAKKDNTENFLDEMNTTECKTK